MTLSRRSAIGLFALAPVASLITRPAFAAEPETFQIDGIAIRGFDPVGYFTDGGPVMGSAEFTTDHNGATWKFANAANRDAFIGDPGKYGARYGGYCAYAAAKGGLAKTVPEAWTIYEDRLYLNFSVTVRGIWSEDIPGNIIKADANWPGILG